LLRARGFASSDLDSSSPKIHHHHQHERGPDLAFPSIFIAMVGLVSAAGLVGFLSEPDPELRSFALKQLDSQVDLLWTEIANSVGEMYEQSCLVLVYLVLILFPTEKHYTKMIPFQSANSLLSSHPKCITISKNMMKAWLSPLVLENISNWKMQENSRTPSFLNASIPL
jgi:hypothetical protein